MQWEGDFLLCEFQKHSGSNCGLGRNHLPGTSVNDLAANEFMLVDIIKE